MLKPLRVGIPLIGSAGWLGGVFYVEHLIRSLRELPLQFRPQVFVLLDVNALAAAEINAGNIAMADGIILRGAGFAPEQRVLDRDCLVAADWQAVFTHVDFVYPVNSAVVAEGPSGSWIPDFQHHHLPHMFSAEECRLRDGWFGQIAATAPTVVVSSETALADFRRFHPDAVGETYVLRFHGRSTPALRAGDPVAVQQRYGLPERFAICCNQFWAHKNHLQLFEAMSRLRDAGDPLHLVCTGATTDYRWPDFYAGLRARLAALGIEDRVHILGLIDRDDQLQLMRRALVLIQPSLFEGWSTVIEDGRALGKPMLLSDTAVHREQAPAGSQFFPIGDAGALAALMRDSLGRLAPGPDAAAEQRATDECALRSEIFARDFCLLAHAAIERFAAPRRSPPPAAPLAAASPEAAAAEPTTPPRVAVATSIAPFGIASQQQAIATWIGLGFEVISVNIADEIRRLRDDFPAVRFVETARSGLKIAGKPYVYVDDLVAALRDSGADVLGIVNSDIILRVAPSTLALLLAEAADSLVFGSRAEIASAEAERGVLYRRGFDFYFFDRRLAAALPRSEFLLGVPWWDYWFPLAADKVGVPLKRCDEHIAFHVTHPVNYTLELTTNFGKRFQSLLGNAHWTRVVAEMQKRNPQLHFAYLIADLAVLRISERSRRLATPPGRPRVTALVSTYASADCIADCLDDLLGQSIADRIEIVVIDAASPQNEGEIVERYRQRHPGIRYVRTPERIGVYAAWNMAIRLATGDYLVSCSTNDRLRPDAFEILAGALDDDPRAGLAYGNSWLVDRPHQSFADFTPSGAYIWETASFESLLRRPGIGPHPMWRRRLHDELGYFDESMRAIADQDFWLRIARRHGLHRLDDFTGLYLVDPASLSGDRARAASEIREVHERHVAAYAFAEWRKPRQLNRALAARVEQALPDVAERPHYRVWIIDHSNALPDLAETIGALAQQLYPGLELVVLSTAACPAQLAGGRIGWQRLTAIDDWLAEIGRQSVADPRAWDLMLPVGARIEANFLLFLSGDIAANPQWRFVFFDDAVVDPQSGMETPDFRAAFNLDWARCGNPLGTGFALRSDAWPQALGLLGTPAGAECLDLGLAIHDRHGATAVGHCAEIAWSCRSDRLRPRQAAAEAAAIGRHLARQQAPATLLPGADGEHFRVRYGQDFAPPVSIVIANPTSDAALDRALRSIVEQTAYPEFEVIITAPAGANDYLDGLRRLDHAQLRVVDLPPRTSGFAAIDHAIGAARGDLVVVFDAAAAVVQPEWLHELVHFFVRPEVGAVGPRLIYADGLIKDGGRVLGLQGPAGAPDCGFRLEYAGSGGRLRVDRQVSALSGECLMLRRAVWPALAEACRPQADEDWSLGVCLTLAAAGLSLIWTPQATVMAAGDSYLLEVEDRELLEKPWPAADAASYRRWLPQLARDPHFSPQLDRHSRGCSAETLPALSWDPAPDAAIPKLFIHLADFAGQGHHRILEPYRLMAERAIVRGGVATRPLLPAEMAAVGADAWVFQRQTKEVDLLAMRRYREYGGGAPVIYDLDDLITDIPTSSPHHKDFGPEVIRRFEQALKLADRLVVSTEVLAQRFARSTGEVRVRPNALAADRWADLVPPRRQGARPRVGWAGSPSHAGDLDVLREVVPALAGEVEWIFMGYCPRELKPYATEIHPWSSLEDYPRRLAGLALDLALAPLAINRFNEAKSHLKLLEYGILGFPVLCTDIVPYQGDFPVGRLKNRAADWQAAIRAAVHAPEANAAAGDALRDHVRRHWMLDDHLDDWRAAWSGR